MKVVSVDGEMPGLHFQKGAILNGEYYSSSGPEIYDWKVENNQFVVNCSAVERINMIVGGPVSFGCDPVGGTWSPSDRSILSVNRKRNIYSCRMYR